MHHAHQPQPSSHAHGSIACCVLLCAIGLLICWDPVLAHHGGLGIEGDLVQWALKVDQWQDEGWPRAIASNFSRIRVSLLSATVHV